MSVLDSRDPMGVTDRVRFLVVLGSGLLGLLVLVSSALASPPAVPSEAAARTQLGGLTVAVTGTTVGYSRDRFPHWSTVSGPCTTREIVLQRDGTDVVPDSACAAASGSWYSPYEGATQTSADRIDIDHVVPLAEAWRSGASRWTESERQAFANDRAGPQLIAVTDTVNQTKGDQPPNFWRPPLRSYWCTYARMWVGTKHNWDLTITADERCALRSMLNTC